MGSALPAFFGSFRDLHCSFVVGSSRSLRPHLCAYGTTRCTFKPCLLSWGQGKLKTLKLAKLWAVSIKTHGRSPKPKGVKLNDAFDPSDLTSLFPGFLFQNPRSHPFLV